MFSRACFVTCALSIVCLNGVCLADLAVLDAQDWESFTVGSTGGSHPADSFNIQFAYGYDIDAFIKFDLSSLPDGVAVSGARLVSKCAWVQNPVTSNMEIYRTADDSWQSGIAGAHDTYPGLDSLLSSAPQDLVQGNVYTWDLDPDGFDWPTDLADGYLTIGLSTPDATSWWYSADTKLEIDLTPVPIPPALLLASLGLFSAGVKLRRGKRRLS